MLKILDAPMKRTLHWPLITLLAVASCTTTTYFAHEPDTAMSRDFAKSTLRQIFEEQPEKSRPVLIEIGDDAIRLGFSSLARSVWTGDLTTLEKRETYYFSNLADLHIAKNKGRWLVNFANRERTVWRWMYFPDQAKAGRFIDAVSRLQRSD
jgi:hypothetical protein